MGHTGHRKLPAEEGEHGRGTGWRKRERTLPTLMHGFTYLQDEIMSVFVHSEWWVGTQVYAILPFARFFS